MTFLQAIFLGIIQGLTEFLPISSTAHLIVLPYLFGWHFDPRAEFAFNVLVQLGTLLAVIVYFSRDLWTVINGFVRAVLKGKPFGTLEAMLGWYLIIATIPAGIFGLLLKKQVEAAVSQPMQTALIMILTAGLIFAADRLGKRARGIDKVNWLDALVIGFFQALAIFPGVSRSGSSISGALFRGLDRPSAARFSFLMSIPIMLAAGLLETVDLIKTPNLRSILPDIAVGFLAAAIVGFFSIRWLLGFLQKRSLTVFVIYRLILGAVVILVSFLR